MEKTLEYQKNILRIVFRRLFCTHDYKFVRNIFGDQIIYCGYKRSLWRCSKCGKFRREDELFPDIKNYQPEGWIEKNKMDEETYQRNMAILEEQLAEAEDADDIDSIRDLQGEIAFLDSIYPPGPEGE